MKTTITQNQIFQTFSRLQRSCCSAVFLLIFLLSASSSWGQNYYSKSTGNLNTLATWGQNTDGTGTAPSNFTTANQVFNIRNNAAPTISANWTVSGTNSKIIVGDGTNACNFTVGSSRVLNAPIDVSANGTITLSTTGSITNINFGTLAASSTVNFASTASQTIPFKTYGNIIISGSKGNNDVTFAGSTTIAGNLTISATGNSGNGFVYFNNTNTARTFTLSGDYIQSGAIDVEFGSGTGSSTINLAGNFSKTAGYMITTISATNAIFNLNGSSKNLQSTGGTEIKWINFNIANSASYTLNGQFNYFGSSGTPAIFTVNSGGTLNCGTFNVVTAGGNATFINSGTLGIGSSAGITSSGATGNIQTTTRTFNTTANYTYNGTTQNTGNGLPNTVNNLTISGTGTTTMTLTENRVVSGNLTVSSGTFTNNGTLTVGTALSGSGGSLTNSTTGILNLNGTCSIPTITNNGNVTSSGSGLITSATITNNLNWNMDGTGAVTAFTNAANGVLNISATPTVPTFTALTTSEAGNTVNYNGLGAQTVRNNTYSNLILSGSGAKTINTAASGTLTSGNLSIAPTGSATASVTNTNVSVNSLTVGGLGTSNTTWGAVASSATNKTNTFFTSGVTGSVLVGNDTCTFPDASNFSIESATNPAPGGTSTVTINSTSLANGTYTVTYDLTGDNTATGSTAAVTITSGTGTFSTSALATAGYTTITITAIKTAAHCSSTISSGNTATILIITEESTTITNTATTTWTAPLGVTSVKVEVWGGGGRGGSTSTNGTETGGGGGGAYALVNSIAVIAGTTYNVNVGAGSTSTSAGGDSWFNTSNTVLAKGGNSGQTNNSTGAIGGSSTNSTGDVTWAGGDGADGDGGSYGGGGGSSAGTSTFGANGSGSSGGTAPSGGGKGGNGPTSNGNGTAGSVPGGGGSGVRSGNSETRTGGAGANGQVKITYKKLTYKSQIISANLGSTNWCPGETRDVTVTIKNIGTATWTDGTGGTPDINIGVKFNTNGTSWSDYNLRTNANNLAPGETGTYTFTIEASNNIGGTYGTDLATGNNNLIFDVVYEGISWFGDNVGGVGPGNTKFTSAVQTILALPTVTSATGNSKTYTGVANATTVSAVASAGATIDWYDALTGGTLLASGTSYAPTAINVGTYTVYAQARNTATGCTSAARTSATLNIGVATPTVTVTVGTYTYNGTAQGPNAATNTGTGTSYTFSYVGTGSTTYPASSTRPTNAGTYTATATVAANGNYGSASSVATAFTIGLASLTITANNGSKTYGQTFTTGSGSANFTSSVLQNGETIGSITIASTGAVNTAAVGTYPIVPSAATGGTFIASNYSITYTDGTLTVGTAALTITADNASKCFGTTYTLGTSAFTPSGLQNGETIGSVTLASTGAASNAAAGSYSITPSAAIEGTFTASNYSITYSNGTLTVNALPTVTTSANQSVCAGSSVTLSGGGATSYAWNNGISNGVAFIPSATTTYTVTGTDGNDCTNTASTTVTVTPTSVGGSIAGSATVCTGTNSTILTLSGHTGAITRWESSLNNFATAGTTIANTTTTLTATNLTATTSYRAVITSGVCAATNSATATVTVSPATAITTQSTATQTVCNGVGFSPISVTATGTGTLTYQWYSNGTNANTGGTSLSPNGQLASYTPSSSADGTLYYYCVVTGSCGSATSAVSGAFVVNALPSSPTAISYNCTGSAVLTATAGSNETVAWYTTNSQSAALANNQTYSSNTATLTIASPTAATYYAFATNANGCMSANGAETPVEVTAKNTWIGGTPGKLTDWFTASNWSCGTIPSATTNAVIPTGKTINIAYAQNQGPAYAGTVVLQGNAQLTVTTDHGINVTNKVTVASGATFTVQNNASLVQTDNVANDGNITVIKQTPSDRPLYIYDAVMWSSPVAQKLKAMSTNTPDSFFMEHSPLANAWSAVANPTETDFTKGKGYLVRTPMNFSFSDAQPWTVNFSGVPNNGPVTYEAGNMDSTERFLLVGNPYPSAISIAAFKAANPNITGVFYFYRKPNSATDITGYGTLSSTGFFTSNDNNRGSKNPGFVIPSGQAFFVRMKANSGNYTNDGKIYFTNTMRVADDHGRFNRINTNQDMYRLFVQTPSTGNNQMIVNYDPETTQNYDLGADAPAFTDGSTDLSSIMNAKNYRIQARGDYNAADVIPLRFKTGVAGEHRIKLQDAQGVFAADQMVIIKDNLTGVQHNLTANGDYVFTATAGTFTNRFEVVYQQAYYTALQANSCGSTLNTMSSLVYADVVNGATGYRFKVVNNTTSAVQTIDRQFHWFAFNMLSSYDYNTAYTISVQVQKDGVWTGYYGTTCSVTSPNIVATGVMQIHPSQCGMTLPTIGTVISTTPVSGATGYKFRITNTTANASGDNLVQEITRTNHWFTLSMLPRYNYGSSYTIEVAVKTTGAFTPYGNACTVYSQSAPTLTSCGQTVATSATIVRTTPMTAVTQYRFQLTRMSTLETITFDKSNHWFTFRTNVPGYAAGEQYGVRVAVMTAGVWSPYGDACDIIAPIATARTNEEAAPSEANLFKPVAYPNPFANTFGIALTTPSADVVHVMVYDLQGRLIEKQNVFVSELDSLQIGTNYPSGDYLLVVAQGANIKSSHIHKD